MTPKQYSVRIEDVTVEVPGAKYTTVKDINLNIYEGEFFGLCGTRNSGANTFCLLINGLAPHATGGVMSGHVYVKDLDTRLNPPKKMAVHVGIVFDDPEGQFLGLTVEDHVSFGPENLNLPVDEIRERVNWAIEAVGMIDLRTRMLNELSGGQKQRVAIAAALAMKPEILVLSDVTFALDPIGVKEVYNVAKELNTTLGMTVIILDQDTENLCEFCDRIGVMDKGEMVIYGEPKQVFTNFSAEYLQSIRVPQVTQLFHMVNKNQEGNSNLPVTLLEAENYWKTNDSLRFNEAAQEKILMDGDKKVVVNISDLTFKYNEFITALTNVSVKIFEGEFVGLIGKNGSGKTTLVKHLNGLLKPTDGKVLVADRDISNESIGELSKYIGYVFQNPDHQLFNNSVRRELEYGPKNLKIPQNEIDDRVISVSQALGLYEYLDIDPYNLSRGERQRVAIASILTMKPAVLILDEPTTGLYSDEVHETLDYIKKLNQDEKLTIIMISHDMRLISEYCERIIVLADSEVVADTNVYDVFYNHAALEQAALEPPQIVKFIQQVMPDKPIKAISVEELYPYIVKE